MSLTVAWLCRVTMYILAAMLQASGQIFGICVVAKPQDICMILGIAEQLWEIIQMLCFIRARLGHNKIGNSIYAVLIT
jgi:hypothetical protein